MYLPYQGCSYPNIVYLTLFHLTSQRCDIAPVRSAFHYCLVYQVGVSILLLLNIAALLDFKSLLFMSGSRRDDFQGSDWPVVGALSVRSGGKGYKLAQSRFGIKKKG